MIGGQPPQAVVAYARTAFNILVFGGIIAFNTPLDAETARAIIDRQFVEVIIAPSISNAAIEAVAAKKNVRLLASGQWTDKPEADFDFKRVNGGLLVQDRDLGMVTAADLKVVKLREAAAHGQPDHCPKEGAPPKRLHYIPAMPGQALTPGSGLNPKRNSDPPFCSQSPHCDA